MQTALCALLVLPLAFGAAAQTEPKPVFTSISWAYAESPLGFQVDLHGEIADAGLAHRYAVLYQIRVHTKKGEEGPILGDARNPGQAIVLGEAGAPGADGSCYFGFTFDLTRKELTGMAQLVKGRMLLRIEPQIYDKTAQRFITPTKSNALIAVIDVGDNCRVHSLVPFGQWFGGCYGESMAKTGLEILASLDAYDLEGNRIVPAFEALFANEDVKPAQLALFVAALPATELAFGKNNLGGHMDRLLEHADAAVKAAAVAKQKEAEALRAERR